MDHIERTVPPTRRAWVFVLDNLNIHGSAGLVELVAEACGVAGTWGRREKGVLKSVASRQAFLSDGHRIRFVYTPKHSSWLNQIEIVFGMIMRKVIRRGNFTSVTDPRKKLVKFIAYFKRGFRQAVPLDVHGSSADEGSGVKLGKRVNHGMTPAPMTFNYEKPARSVSENSPMFRPRTGLRWALAFSASAQPPARTLPLNSRWRCCTAAKSSADCGSSRSVATRLRPSPSP